MKAEMFVLIPSPNCELFQIHGNKFKPDPICYMGEATVKCITHTDTVETIDTGNVQVISVSAMLL